MIGILRWIDARAELDLRGHARVAEFQMRDLVEPRRRRRACPKRSRAAPIPTPMPVAATATRAAARGVLRGLRDQEESGWSRSRCTR